MVKKSTENIDAVKQILGTLSDPEIPVLSIMDMGIVQKIDVKNQSVLVEIIPTYSGCPAMDTIADDIKKALQTKGFEAKVQLVLSPAWTTDFINERGRKALEAYGIAAPLNEAQNKAALVNGKRIVKCTNCNSTNTKLLSEFGSTACKALFQCEDCLEPFDYFKCLK